MSFVQTSDTLDKFLLSFNKSIIYNIMLEALDIMQAYNGRSITYCICEAIGAETAEHDDGTYSWKLPSRSEVRRQFR
jgi:hypothetical protein